MSDTMAQQEFWRLCAGVDGRKIAEVREAIARGANVNYRSEADFSEGMSCLMAAVANGGEAVVRLLLFQPDIKVNARDEMGRTALHFACAFSNKAILRMLLGFPSLDPNVTNNNGRTALMEAIVDAFDFYRICRIYRDQGHDTMRTDIVQQMANAPRVDLDAKDLCGRSLEEQVQWLLEASGFRSFEERVHRLPGSSGFRSLEERVQELGDPWVLLPAVLSAARQHILHYNDFVFFVAVDISDFSNIYHLKSAIPCNQPA